MILLRSLFASVAVCGLYLFLALHVLLSVASPSSPSMILFAASAAGATPVTVDGETGADFKALLRQGDVLVANQGRPAYPDAVAKFSQALEIVPTSPKALYKRAELLYLQRKFAEAKADLDAVLKVDPMHRRAIEYLIKVCEAMGDVTAAVAGFERLARVYSAAGQRDKASNALHEAERRKQVAREWESLQEVLASDELRAREPGDRRDVCERCVQVIKELIAVSGGGSKIDLRLKMAECAVLGRLHGVATDELGVILKMQQNNLQASALHAQLLRSLGSMDRARAEIRRCLKLDPEYKPCIKLHKSMKKYLKIAEVVEKQIADKEWAPAIAGIDKLLALGADEAPNVEQLWRWKCEGYVELRDVDKGFDACDTCIRLESSGSGDKNPQIADPLLWRADLHLLQDNIDEAESDINRARDVNSQHAKINQYTEKIQKIRRQGQRKNYYDILGVTKTASDAEIRKAYRKKSREFHPDVLRSKEMTEQERSRADKLYRDMNEAKEMLLDAEKRRRYDSGEDPTKPPEQQQPFHGSHFNFNFGGDGGGGGFDPFGGGGFPGGGFPGGGGNQHFEFRFG